MSARKGEGFARMDPAGYTRGLRGRDGELLTTPEGGALEALRNPELALKAAELLGKNKRLWGTDEEQTRVTVQIVNLAGDQQATPIMDGEFTAVPEDDN